MRNSFVVTGYQVPVAGKYRLQVAGCRLQGKPNTSYQLPGAGCRGIQVPGCWLQGNTGCMLQGKPNTSYRLPVAGEYRLQVSGCRENQIPVTSYRVPVAGEYRFQVTSLSGDGILHFGVTGNRQPITRCSLHPCNMQPVTA